MTPEQLAIEAKRQYHIDKDSTDKTVADNAFDKYMDSLDEIQKQHHS